ncbi:unnamed protein product [Hymenolepis diminuta]|uniref:Uncharacterized protein n=1 Tax=Hymenolepis diminuta TaxID=6216 RepID=A0A0R3SGT3_HYMDI|nr:unnamed protein product [Hymenolepis diminuta]
MAEIDQIFILFKVEEQNTFFDDESMTDSELAYLFDDVRKIEDNVNQTATLPSKGKVAALIEFFESLQKESMKNNHARRVHDSNLNTTSDQQSTDMKVNELKDWVKTNSAEIICIPPQTADARLVITTTSSLSDLAASSDQSTHLFKPHARLSKADEQQQWIDYTPLSELMATDSIVQALLEQTPLMRSLEYELFLSSQRLGNVVFKSEKITSNVLNGEQTRMQKCLNLLKEIKRRGVTQFEDLFKEFMIEEVIPFNSQVGVQWREVAKQRAEVPICCTYNRYSDRKSPAPFLTSISKQPLPERHLLNWYGMPIKQEPGE